MRGGGAVAAAAFIHSLTPEVMKDPAGRCPAEAVGAGEGVLVLVLVGRCSYSSGGGVQYDGESSSYLLSH